MKPQSNQRGIETSQARVWTRLCKRRLNRTSVGLKRSCPLAGRPRLPAPQSNQRGIETDVGEGPAQAGVERLNRTSVGLKRLRLKGRSSQTKRASIEPAWD